MGDVSAQETLKGTPPTKSRRWFLTAAATAAGAAIAVKLDKNTSVVNSTLDNFANLFPNLEHAELKQDLTDLQQATDNCQEFIEEMAAFPPFKDIFPGAKGETYRDYYLNPLIHHDVLTATYQQCQSLLTDKGLIGLLVNPNVIRQTMRELYQANLNDRVGGNANFIGPWSWNNVIGFGTDKEVKTRAPEIPDEIINASPEECQRIKKAIETVRQRFPVRVPLSDSHPTITNAAAGYDVLANRILLFSEAVEPYYSDDPKRSETFKADIIAHEYGHFFDIFNSPWLYAFIDRGDLRELLQLRWEALADNVQEFFTHSLSDYTNWYLSISDLSQPRDPNIFLNNLDFGMAHTYLEDSHWDRISEITPSRFMSNSDEIKTYAQLTNQYGASKAMLFAIEEYHDEIDRVLQSFSYQYPQIYEETAVNTMKGIVAFFVFKGIAEGKYPFKKGNLYDQWLLEECCGMLGWERERFAEAVGAYTCLTAPELALPINHDELAETLRQSPSIKYLNRLLEILGDDKIARLIDISKENKPPRDKSLPSVPV